MQIDEDTGFTLTSAFDFFDVDWNDFMQAKFTVNGTLRFTIAPDTIVTTPAMLPFPTPALTPGSSTPQLATAPSCGSKSRRV